MLLQAVQARADVEPAATLAELDLSGGSMAGSLIEIGRQYGVIVSFKPDLVERQAPPPPVQGRYTLVQALALVLRDSTLSAHITPEGIVTLRTERQPAGSKADDDALSDSASSTSETASEPPSGSYVMERVVVYGKAERGGAEPDDGFLASSSEGATLTDTPLAQLPQAVSVVTRDMLELTQVQTQIDAMDYVAGVSLQPGLEPQSGIVGKVRGFPAQYSVSGISSLRCAFGVDSAFIERIEVFKGPGGTVGGVADNGGRGGVINVVRKRPRPGWQYEVTGSASSQDDGTLRSTFDVGAGDDGTHWRLVGYGTRSGRTDGGYSARHGGGLLGAISQHGDDFSATLTWQHDHRRETPPAMSRWAWTFGVPPVIEEGRQTPVSKDDGTSLRFSDAELDAEWRLSSAWRLRGKARWGRGNMDARRHQYSPDQMGAWFDRYDTRFSDNARQWTLVGDVLTGPLKHKLLLGADAQVQRVVSGWQNAGWFVDPEVFVPGRSELPPTDAGEPLVERTRYTQKGVLLQDQVSIGPVQLRLAMRRTAFSDVYDVLGAEELRNVTGKSWEAGAAYQLTPSTVVYAGVQSALEAAYDHGITLFDGSIAPPHRSRQSQAGMKFGPLDGRLSVTLEAYRIKRLGAIGYGMDNEAWVVPSEYSRGIELEATGRPSAALDLAFGVNLISAREHLPANQQVEPYRVPTAATPPRSMHLLGRYRLPEGLVRDTSIGMALRAYSDTWVQAPDPEGMVWSQRIPGGARLDLSWTRRFGNGSFAVSVFNVFDRRLYGASTNTEFVPVLPGRSLSVMLAFKG